MKKTAYYYLSLAAIVAGGLVSCQDENQGFTEGEVHEAAVKRQYAKNFEDRYGQIDPNHTWGFGEIGARNEGSTRAVNTESNLWYATYGLNVPGQPHHLHQNFVGTVSTDKTIDNVKTYYNPYQPSEFQNAFATYVGNAIGDVTPEERDYVFNYFNTTVRPSDETHWSEFFIQYVDCWNERFPNEPQRNMDQLGCQAIDGSWEHINDFNGETHSIKYVQNAGTEAWSYKTSHADGSVSDHDVYDRYRMYHIVFDIDVDSNNPCPYGCDTHHYDGWYIGFDYHSIKGDDGDVVGDGKYIDWIVKVSPGTYNDFSSAKRVMCEDLGNTLDFDFNDVVFDVSYEGSGPYTAIIALQAAGGTMKINVGINNDTYEAHALLENAVTQPVNVDAGASHAVAIYRVSGLSTTNPDDIKIWVNQDTESDSMDSIFLLDDASKSSVPQKFAVPTSVRWTKENQQIEWAYELFPEWVKDNESFADHPNPYWGIDGPTITYWYAPTKNGAWPNHGGKKWTDTIHEEFMY